MDNQPPYSYETRVDWTGQKAGVLRAAGLPTIEVAPPPEFRGTEGVWTPEHLFVAAVNSCFMTTFLAIAELSKLEFVSFDCRVVGLLEKLESAGYQITEMTLSPHVVVLHSRDTERARRILERPSGIALYRTRLRQPSALNPRVSFDRNVEVESREPN